MAESRKGKTGLEWLLREADKKPASTETVPAAPGSVPVPSAAEPWEKAPAPAPAAHANGNGAAPATGAPAVTPGEPPVTRPSRIVAANGNRRTTQRVKATFEARYKKGSEQITASGVNLSLGGFYVETKKHLPLGDVFQAQLVFPAHANRRLAVIAEVIHHEDGGLGAKFLDVDDKDRPFLEELISKGTPTS